MSSSSSGGSHQQALSQAIQCLICGRREPKRTLPSHVAEHLGFWTHNCTQCGFKTTYESEAMDHEGESGHRVDPINVKFWIFSSNIPSFSSPGRPTWTGSAASSTTTASSRYIIVHQNFSENTPRIKDRHGGSMELVLKRQFSLFNDDLGEAGSPQDQQQQQQKPQLRERSRSDVLAVAAGTKDDHHGQRFYRLGYF